MKTTLSKEVDLGKDSVGHLLFTLAAPAIASQLVNALYNVVDRMYIGHIPDVGAAALTGVGICFPIIMIISAFAALLGSGGAPRASICMGKKDNETAEKILGNCFSALLIASVVLSIVVSVWKRPLLMLFGASANTIGYAQSYMSIYALGTIFVQMTLGLNVFISAQGFSKISMLTVVIGAVTNIILDPIFIFALDMGVTGAALATVISQAVSAIWALRFLTGKQTILRIKKKNLKIEWKILLPCIALGVAPFVMQATESVLILCFNSSLLKYGGDLAVGTMTILSSVMQFAMLPLQGLTQGAQPIMSYNYGARKKERLKKIVKLTVVSCFSYALFICVLVELFPGMFIGIFTPDKELTAFSIPALRIYFAAIFLMGLQVSCQQAFVSFGNAKVSAFLAMFRKLMVLIPMIYLLPHFMENKVLAVFTAEPISDIIAVFTTVTMFFFSFRKLLREMPVEN